MTILAGFMLVVGVAAAQAVTINVFPDELRESKTPDHIAAGPDGNLWFTAYGGTLSVDRFTTAGKLSGEFPVRSGGGPHVLGGITAGPDGNVWFTNNGAVGRISPEGTVAEFAAEDEPQGITAAPDGNLWFATRKESIGRITTGGSVTEFQVKLRGSCCEGLSRAQEQYGIGLGPEGNLWFTEKQPNEIAVITPGDPIYHEAQFSDGITSKSEPDAITAGLDGNLWFTQPGSDQIGRITPEGVVTEFSSGITPNSEPEEIAVGSDGNLWFTQPRSNQIGRITPAGVVTEFSEGINDPQGITAGPEGNLWFTEGTPGAIGRLIPDPVPPSVLTDSASVGSNTTATLSATVNPHGAAVTECKLEYGTTVSYGQSAPCSPSPGSGISPVAVSAAIMSLTANTTYHFRISATNTNGTSYGSDVSFATLPNAPAVVTESAFPVTPTSATLNAAVNPEGGSVSACRFDYGASKAYGSSIPCSSMPGSGEGPVAVSASVGGLSASTSYHFRIVATNPGGTSYSSDQTFTTPANPILGYWYKSGVKVKQGISVPTISWGTVTLSSEEGNVTCRTASVGSLENPVGGAPGVDSTETFATAGCVAPGCPAVIEVKAEKLPWQTELSEVAGVIRDKATGVNLRIRCYVPPAGEEPEKVLSNDLALGELAPSFHPGTSAAKPSFVEFDPGSGELGSEAGPSKATGELKIQGFDGQDVITVK